MSTPREGLLIDAFVRAADTLVAEYDVVDLLQQLVEDCTALLPVDAAGLLLGDEPGGARLVAATSEDARLLELFAVQADEGPCLEAMAGATRVGSADLAGELERWPRFAPAALEAGFGAVHAVPLRLRSQVIGVLGLFGSTDRAPADAPTGGDLAVAQGLADVATIGVLHHQVVARSEALNEQLQTALNTRVVIEQAKGVLAERGAIGMDEAFQRLRRHARGQQLKLSEVARGVVDGTVDRGAVLDGGGDGPGRARPRS
ncbi:GAF and ANTAR domain-containing protein [Rhodococcus aerolatus]